VHELVEKLRLLNEEEGELWAVSVFTNEPMPEGIERYQVKPRLREVQKLIDETEQAVRDELVRLAGESLVDCFEEITRDHAYGAMY